MNPLQLKQSLKDRMLFIEDQYLNAVYETTKANKHLPKLCRFSIPSFSNVFKETFNEWLQETCAAYSKLATCSSIAVIQKESLPKHLSSLTHIEYNANASIARAIDYYTVSNQEMLDALLSVYKFDALHESLTAAGTDLERVGLSESADAIARGFSILEFPYDTGRYPAFRSNNTGFFMKFLSYGSTYDGEYCTQLHDLAAHIKVLEDETGAKGLYSDFVSLSQQLTFETKLKPTRTVLKGSGAIDFVMYSKKIEFRLRKDLAESVISFVKRHSTLKLALTKDAA